LPDEYSSEGIIEGMKKLRIEGKKILLPRADIAPSFLPEGLRKLGARVKEVAAYRTELSPGENSAIIRDSLRKGKIDIVIFTSSSTVNNFVKLVGDIDLAGARVACIGPLTANEAEKSGMKPDIVPQEYTMEGLVEEIINVLSNPTIKKA
jgi:uroporphyrinogen III methyltransferase/synthase